MTDEAFAQAARTYGDTIYRVALHALNNLQDAEDVTQTVLLKLYECKKDFESEEHVKHWILRVAVNESRRIAAHPWRRRAVSLEEAREPVFQDRERRELYQAVMDLPGKYRVPLYLYYYEGYAVNEVGELLGLKPSTVQTRLARGREKLKTILTEE